jgi:hypothetical protein
MISILAVTVLAVLAVVTRAMVVVIELIHPRQGRLVEVAGAILNVVELG